MPVKFGNAGTLDHKVLNEDDASRDGDRNACIISDTATYWALLMAMKQNHPKPPYVHAKVLWT